MKVIPILSGLATSAVMLPLVCFTLQHPLHSTNRIVDVIEDAKYKRREALADLASKVAK